MSNEQPDLNKEKEVSPIPEKIKFSHNPCITEVLDGGLVRITYDKTEKNYNFSEDDFELTMSEHDLRKYLALCDLYYNKYVKESKGNDYLTGQCLKQAIDHFEILELVDRKQYFPTNELPGSQRCSYSVNASLVDFDPDLPAGVIVEKTVANIMSGGGTHDQKTHSTVFIDGSAIRHGDIPDKVQEYIKTVYAENDESVGCDSTNIVFTMIDSTK